MWKSIDSVGIMVFRRGPGPRFLLLEGGEGRGLLVRPITQVVKGTERHVSVASRVLEEMGLRVGEEDLKDLDLRLTYYTRETKVEQRVLAVEAPEGLEPPVGGTTDARWVGFEEALRTLTLTAHRKALIKVFSELVSSEGPVVGSMADFDHVPVEHPSGTVVLCDFDGTASEEEASIAILKAFAPEAWERYEEAWLRKELTTHECLGLQFTIITSPMDELARFAAENVDLRKGFARFVKWCKAKGHGLVITSSGIDLYIRAILERNGLGDVIYLANRGLWTRDDGLIIEEGMVNVDCEECGNCKTMLVDLYRERGARVVFVGDGLTDECPSRRADMVFARAGLLEFCRKEGIEHMGYDSFDDVRDGLERWLS